MNARRYLPVALAIAAISMALPLNAAPASPRAQRVLALRKAEGVRTRSWLKPNAESSTPLVYASLITSIDTGETNVYSQSGSTLSLVGQLSEGGGPIATDAKGDIYVAESGSNVLGVAARNVYVYLPGTTSPSLVLENPNYSSLAIAVSPSGRVYVAGPSIAVYGSSSALTTGVMVYQVPSAIPAPPSSGAPPSIAGTLLPGVTANPAVPTGIDADSSGNLFAGWTPLTGSPCVHSYLQGCATELPVNGPTWKRFLPVGQAVNDISAGPVLTSDESQTIVAGLGNFEYLVTFPKGSYIPSAVVTLPVTGAQEVPGIVSIAVDSGGQALWTANGGLLSGALPSTIWKLEYPSGSVSLAFPIPQTTASSPTGLAIPLGNAVAVSPAYAP